MRRIIIDGSKTMTIGGDEYYYADITIDEGCYVIVPDKNDHIAINEDNSGWSICRGNSYKPSNNTLVRLVVDESYANLQEVTPFTYTIEYDITPLRIVQLEDSDAYPITPYTSAKGVILNNGKDVEFQINNMDPSVISEEESEALAIISGACESAVNDVKEEGAEYRTDIDELSAHVEELDAKVFPLTINYTISPNFSSYQNTINVTVKEYDTGEPNINEEYVEKWVNDSYAGKIYEPVEYYSSFSFTEPIQGMKEVFRFVAKTVNNKSESVSATRYLCFYGANKASEMTSDIALTLSKTLATSVSFNPTITTRYGQYIWIIVPNYLSIRQVKSAGFDVTLDTPTSVSIGTFGTYKCYRTLNALDDATWKLVIT